MNPRLKRDNCYLERVLTWSLAASFLFSYFHSIAVARSKDVPSFGPPIPSGGTFRKSPEFVDFLMAKSELQNIRSMDCNGSLPVSEIVIFKQI